MSEGHRFQGGWGFLGLEEAPAEAGAWVLPVPYEATTTCGAGAREGPAAIIAASREVELYDPELECEPSSAGIRTLPPLEPVSSSPADMVASIESCVTDLLGGEPSPGVLAVLGGEHTISVGVARGVKASRGELVTVQLDAHADLRESYRGSPYSHACTSRRLLEAGPVVQLGVRSLSRGEEEFRRSCDSLTTFFAREVLSETRSVLDELGRLVEGKRVFLTIDLDVLDPSIMPATGTPEPGGLSWEVLMRVVGTVCRGARELPAFDVVELAPIPAMKAPDFLAAKLVYRTIGLALRGRNG